MKHVDYTISETCNAAEISEQPDGAQELRPEVLIFDRTTCGWCNFELAGVDPAVTRVENCW